VWTIHRPGLLGNESGYRYRARLWNSDFIYVGSVIAADHALRISAHIPDTGRYIMVVTRFNATCTQCRRPPQLVHAVNVTVLGSRPDQLRLSRLPSCTQFVGARGRWVRHAMVCASVDNAQDQACAFPAALDGRQNAWLWVPFRCAYRPPPLDRLLQRNVTVLLLGDSTSRFLWGPFVSLFEDRASQRFSQRSFGAIRSANLARWKWDSNQSSVVDVSSNDSIPVVVTSRCDWESNVFLWQRNQLRIIYGHPFWTCHNRVQCSWAKQCHIRPEDNRRSFLAFVRQHKVDYALVMTQDTAAGTGCSPLMHSNAQVQAAAMLRAARGACVYMDQRSLVGFVPDNGARLHCVNAAVAAATHAVFIKNASMETIFDGSIDLYTLTDALYHFSYADATLTDAFASAPVFRGDGIHAGGDANLVLATMLAVHVFANALVVRAGKQTGRC